MTRALRTRTTVRQGGRVEIQSAELAPGTSVEVIVLQADDSARASLASILEDYPGGRLFTTAEQVDAAMREERDSWES